MFDKDFSETPLVTNEQIKHVENQVNQLIRDGKKVTVSVYTENSTEDELKQVNITTH